MRQMGHKPHSGKRSEGRNMVFAALTRGLMTAAFLFAAVSSSPAQSRRPNSTRARPSNSTSATASAAATTFMRACSRATSASIFPAIRPWCRKTWRARAALRLANWLYNVGPKDGTVFGTIGRGTAFDPLLGNKAAQFEATKFTWIGSANNEVSVCVAWDGHRRHQVRGHAEQGTDRRRHQHVGRHRPVSAIMNGVLGTKMKVVTGYPGGNEVGLAMERGEVQGRCGWSWSSVKSTHQKWLDEKKFNMLVQIALEKHPDLPDVPSIIDLAKTDEQRQILRLIFARQVMGRPFVRRPACRRTALRRCARRSWRR